MGQAVTVSTQDSQVKIVIIRIDFSAFNNVMQVQQIWVRNTAGLDLALILD